MRTRSIFYLTAAMAVAFDAAPAMAQQTLGNTVVKEEPEDDSSAVSGFVALGAAGQPTYDGSDRYQVGPLAFANLQWRGVELQLRGTRARLDLVADSHIQFGPAIGMRGNRDHEDATGAVARLADIKTGIEVGGYVGYRFGGDEHGRSEIGVDLTVLKDVNDAHDGIVAIGQVSYAAVRGSKFFLDVDAQTTFGDRKYTQTYFGITPQQAAISGLETYSPGAGLRDVGTGITAGYQFNRRWGLISRIGGSYYIGDVKDSPIVEAGSRAQIVGGLGVTYRF